MSTANRAKTYIGVIVPGVFLILLIFSSYDTSAQTKIPKAVFIIVDGIPADLIEKLNPPVLKETSIEGGFTRAHAVGEKVLSQKKIIVFGLLGILPSIKFL